MPSPSFTKSSILSASVYADKTLEMGGNLEVEMETRAFVLKELCFLSKGADAVP